MLSLTNILLPEFSLKYHYTRTQTNFSHMSQEFPSLVFNYEDILQVSQCLNKFLENLTILHILQWLQWLPCA